MDEQPVMGERPVEPPKGFHEKPCGMDNDSMSQFMTLVCMGLERMSRRQRYEYRRVLKPIIREMNVRWPFGRPIGDIQREIAEEQAKVKIIIPQGVNADALKEKPNA